MSTPPIRIATRGSALALAQANAVLAKCQQELPKLQFELVVIKTTGDKLQSASLANPDGALPKGLFTKELEVALLEKQADLAVHSLKDLPTELPPGLRLGAVCKRADVRDVLIYRSAELAKARVAVKPLVDWVPGQRVVRGFKPRAKLKDFPADLLLGTSSTRRKAQLLALRPGWSVDELRGNVPTRLHKLAEHTSLDAIVLAAAGLERLKFRIFPDGSLRGEGVPAGLCATRLEPEEMLPAVGQGAVGIEVRVGDERLVPVLAALDHFTTHHAVLAERAFLRGMGGGCATPVGAYAKVHGHQVRLRVVSFVGGVLRRGEEHRPVKEAEALGELLAAQLSGR